MPSKRTENKFVVTACDGKEGSTLWLVKVLQLFRLNTQTDSALAKDVFLTYTEYTPKLDEVDGELRCVCFMGRTTDEK